MKYVGSIISLLLALVTAATASAQSMIEETTSGVREAWPAQGGDIAPLREALDTLAKSSWTDAPSHPPHIFGKTARREGNRSLTVVNVEFGTSYFLNERSPVGETAGPSCVLYQQPSPPLFAAMQRSTRGRVSTLAVLFLEGDTWRSVECRYYPDGSPMFVACGEDGVPGYCTALWSPGTVDPVVVWDGLHPQDPRWREGGDPNQPPRDLQAPPVSRASRGTVRLYVSFLPPDDAPAPPSDWPWYSLLQAPAGEAVVVASPKLPGAKFVGWSGASTAKTAPVRLTPKGVTDLTAHYEMPPEIPGRWLQEALTEVLKTPVEGLRAQECLESTDLDVSGRYVADLTGLKSFMNLETLKVSDNSIATLAPLGTTSDIVAQAMALAEAGIASTTPLNLLTTHFAPARRLTRLHTLRATNTQLTSLLGVGQLPALEVLEANGGKIEDWGDVSGAVRLRELRVSNNALDSFYQFNAPPGLTLLDLRDNQLRGLSDLVNYSGCPSGMEVLLTGNPLSESSEERHLKKLREGGVEVVLNALDSAPPGGDVDTDGDGFTDAEEWRFASLFDATQQGVKDRYDAVRTNPEEPGRYLSFITSDMVRGKATPGTIDSIPTESVSIQTQGAGTVFPGAGIHEFAAYRFYEDGTWSGNPVSFEALPESGWRFSHFTVNSARREENPTQITVEPHQGAPLMQAFFVESAAVQHPGIVDAYLKFFPKLAPGADPWTFDRNGMYWEMNNSKNEGNGVPDIAEFAFMELLLTTPESEWTHSYRGDRYDIHAAWKANLQTMRQELGNQMDDPGALKTLAMYMCYSRVEGFVSEVTKRLYGFELQQTYERRASNDLRRLEDFDLPDYWRVLTATARPTRETTRLFAEHVWEKIW